MDLNCSLRRHSVYIGPIHIHCICRSYLTTPYELKQQSKQFSIAHVHQEKAVLCFQMTGERNGQKTALQVDFSENATITAQREVQAVHWCHIQVTVFTAHAWINEGVNLNIVIMSDDPNHTKYSVYTYMHFNLWLPEGEAC